LSAVGTGGNRKTRMMARKIAGTQVRTLVIISGGPGCKLSAESKLQNFPNSVFDGRQLFR
jgi:hypothetical protein